MPWILQSQDGWGQFMRLGASAAIAATLFGCIGPDANYASSGIGNDLSTADSAKQTGRLLAYTGLLCAASGLGGSPVAGGGYACTDPPSTSTEWRAFTTAGLNDIDARCDAYLDWLDDRKRTREPILKEFGDVQRGVQAIMHLSGADVDSILIVAAAFGIATDTFTNLESRLIFEVNSSTVRSFVRTRQVTFRDALARKQIGDLPTAVYILRSYLRICSPYSIEADINVTLSNIDEPSAKLPLSGQMGGIGNAPLLAPSKNSNSVVQVVPLDPDKALPGADTKEETTISEKTLRAWQRALCVKESGAFDDQTRTGFQHFLLSQGLGPPSRTLGDKQMSLVTAYLKKPCPVDATGAYIYKNYYEFLFYSTSKPVVNLQNQLNRIFPNDQINVSGILDPATRKKIAEFRAKLKDEGKPIAGDLGSGDELSQAFRNAIRQKDNELLTSGDVKP